VLGEVGTEAASEIRGLDARCVSNLVWALVKLEVSGVCLAAASLLKGGLAGSTEWAHPGCLDTLCIGPWAPCSCQPRASLTRYIITDDDDSSATGPKCLLCPRPSHAHCCCRSRQRAGTWGTSWWLRPRPLWCTSWTSPAARCGELGLWAVG